MPLDIFIDLDSPSAHSLPIIQEERSPFFIGVPFAADILGVFEKLVFRASGKETRDGHGELAEGCGSCAFAS